MNEPSLVSLPTSKWRVKLYKLVNSQWTDTGTGTCWGEVIAEKPHIVVENEDSPRDLLLKIAVAGPQSFQKQDTLIIWTQDHKELALSFQEVTGCVILCEYLVHCRGVYDSAVEVTVAPTNGEPARTLEENAVLPPLPRADNLELVLSRLTEGCKSSYMRDAISVWFLQTDYLSELSQLFGELEPGNKEPEPPLLPDTRLEALHQLCQVTKALFAMGENLFIDMLLEDALFPSFLGMLEYDRDFGKRKANYRSYFSSGFKFKEIMPIDDGLMDKIRKTFRLQLLKDVVLARLLDDAMFNALTSLILVSYMEIIGSLQSNSDFMTKFFGLYDNNTSAPVKDDGVVFITHILAHSKVFAQQRVPLYLNLIDHGLLRVLSYGLKRPVRELRSSGLECIRLLLDSEINVIESSKPVMCALLELCKHSSDPALQLQACETLKGMLEPPSNPDFAKTFYESCADEVFSELAAPTLALDYDPDVLIDLLGYCLRYHRAASDRLLGGLGLWTVVANLLARPQLSKSALLSCVRCLKYMLIGCSAGDVAKLVESGALASALGLLARIGNVNTLLHSALLDLLVACAEQPKAAPVREWILANRPELAGCDYKPLRELLKAAKRPPAAEIDDSPRQRFKPDAAPGPPPATPATPAAPASTPGPGTPRPKKQLKRAFPAAGQSETRLVSFKD